MRNKFIFYAKSTWHYSIVGLITLWLIYFLTFKSILAAFLGAMIAIILCNIVCILLSKP